jgi:hypothetical protein
VDGWDKPGHDEKSTQSFRGAQRANPESRRWLAQDNFGIPGSMLRIAPE